MTVKKAKTKPSKVLAPQFGIRRQPRTRYLYVEARGWGEEVTDGLGGSYLTLREPISFDSVIVRAKSEPDAFALGTALLQLRREDDPTAGHNHASGTFLNDYVVKL